MSASQRPTLRPSSTSAARTGTSATPSIPRPPLSVHPNATISETVYFQGKHPISIGAGTVIHPRARLLSFEGPISVGEGCIIGEKSVVGNPQAPQSASEHSSGSATSPTPAVTIIENSVLIAPLSTVSSGSHIHSAATIDASAFLGRHVRIGRHAKLGEEEQEGWGYKGAKERMEEGMRTIRQA
ncbi:transferase hexapeptide domain-containing protein [Coccidioides immitis RS]|uniref:Dynactin subunit 6 n=3 Tax=Coccidioides immitis TaxID=5501 RepID=A0A0D8JV38_COCIM|nr:transferase hexapeptide domain-containing protein [Coccidioides immitis RS]KJF60128.1 transferase hexapeptide domain-containing protein [Coccidioides immitis RS]KMP01667.1 transferase hexapeptide domain containing protein [Coccidioides immitis RMSCC 2394]KMU76354.1 transferase hexapeptide domain containing protein [Coccidioides immitis RMSCC 3703]